MTHPPPDEWRMHPQVYLVERSDEPIESGAPISPVGEWMRHNFLLIAAAFSALIPIAAGAQGSMTSPGSPSRETVTGNGFQNWTSAQFLFKKLALGAKIPRGGGSLFNRDIR